MVHKVLSQAMVSAASGLGAGSGWLLMHLQDNADGSKTMWLERDGGERLTLTAQYTPPETVPEPAQVPVGQVL